MRIKNEYQPRGKYDQERATARLLLNAIVIMVAAVTYATAVDGHPSLRVLATTGKVPNEPVVFRNKLAPEKRQAILSAFKTIGDTADGRRVLNSIADITGFRPVSDTIYRPMRELIRSEGKSVYDILPEGLRIQMMNNPGLPD